MKSVGAYEAKIHFGEWLTRVENGEIVIVTRHGVPVARLMPMDKTEEDADEAMEEIHRFRRERRPTLNGITISELIEDGRAQWVPARFTTGGFDENDRGV